MVNYGYECRGWTAEQKKLLRMRLLRVWPHIEIDELYDGVRLRQLTQLTSEELEKVVDGADAVLEEVEKELGRRS